VLDEFGAISVRSMIGLDGRLQIAVLADVVVDEQAENWADAREPAVLLLGPGREID
jgi:hypothetical protein